MKKKKKKLTPAQKMGLLLRSSEDQLRMARSERNQALETLTKRNEFNARLVALLFPYGAPRSTSGLSTEHEAAFLEVVKLLDFKTRAEGSINAGHETADRLMEVLRWHANPETAVKKDVMSIHQSANKY